MSLPLLVRGELRDCLVDWLTCLFHRHLSLSEETEMLVIGLTDRFLQKQAVAPDRLKNLGIAAIHIMAKYEEVVSPSLLLLSNIANVPPQDILDMETLVLSVLDYRLSDIVTVNQWLCLLMELARPSDVVLPASYPSLVKYLGFLALSDHGLACQRPSLLAASALYLSNSLCKARPWDL